MRRLLVPVLLVLLAVAPTSTPSADAGDGALFSPAAAPAGRAADVHARRERYVTVDPGVLLAAGPGGGGSIVEFNLFDDTVLTGVAREVQGRGARGFTWVGRVGAGGTAVVTVHEGAMVGRIVDPERGTFTISPRSDGVHVVAEVDPGSYLPEEDVAAPSGRAVGDGPISGGGRSGEPVVSVLVVYTADAARGMGGNARVEALAANAVAETNQAYQDSGVAHRLELAGVRRVSYRESDHSLTNLDRLTRDDDGYLDEVHGWREELAADLVMLIVTPMANACGSAWIMSEADLGFAGLAFGVASYDCVLANLSFAHETGHLFGANHEPAEAGRAIFRYAYAYVDCLNGFRTVMAYGTECGVQPGRVARFSSPDHPYAGFPAGDELRDNARTLNRTAPLVALFRTPAAVCAGREATIAGTAEADILEGTPGVDVIHGLGGDDVIYGRGGDDVICGGEGNDTILPGSGVDEVYGEAGNDRVEAGPALVGIIDGGAGRDLLDLSAVTDGPVFVDLATGEIYIGAGACIVQQVEKVLGSAWDDVIKGDGRRNVIRGGPGDDRLVGRGGPDALRGGPGDDVVLGGAGDDLLRGGPGGDALHGRGGADRIYGDGGADYLRGGAGRDLLYGDVRDLGVDGGPGEDWCRLSGGAPAAC